MPDWEKIFAEKGYVFIDPHQDMPKLAKILGCPQELLCSPKHISKAELDIWEAFVNLMENQEKISDIKKLKGYIRELEKELPPQK